MCSKFARRGVCVSSKLSKSENQSSNVDGCIRSQVICQKGKTINAKRKLIIGEAFFFLFFSPLSLPSEVMLHFGVCYAVVTPSAAIGPLRRSFNNLLAHVLGFHAVELFFSEVELWSECLEMLKKRMNTFWNYFENVSYYFFKLYIGAILRQYLFLENLLFFKSWFWLTNFNHFVLQIIFCRSTCPCIFW